MLRAVAAEIDSFQRGPQSSRAKLVGERGEEPGTQRARGRVGHLFQERRGSDTPEATQQLEGRPGPETQDCPGG